MNKRGSSSMKGIMIMIAALSLAGTVRASRALTLGKGGQARCPIHVDPDIMAPDRNVARHDLALYHEVNRRRLRESVADLSRDRGPPAGQGKPDRHPGDLDVPERAGHGRAAGADYDLRR